MAVQRNPLQHRERACDLDYLRYPTIASTLSLPRLVLHHPMRVEVHKKCVIWVTVGGLDQRTDVNDKGRIDLGSRLAERR